MVLHKYKKLGCSFLSSEIYLRTGTVPLAVRSHTIMIYILQYHQQNVGILVLAWQTRQCLSQMARPNMIM